MKHLTLIAAFLALVSGCASFPDIQAEPSYALTDTHETRLGQGVAREAQKHSAPSGFLLLGDGLDAFASRLLLMEAAEVSLDVQYYLFHNDATARLFTHYLLRAADRGVRVRMLLDDFGHEGQEALFSALVQHPNISVRLFNPFANRALPYLNFLTDFSRVNRRMHNKSFIADNQAAIIGGRNIGDTYFAANIYTNFLDLDVLGVGEFAPNVSAAFDLYWNHKLSIPVRYLSPASDATKLAAVRKQLQAATNTERSVEYLTRLQSLHMLEDLMRGQLKLYWAESALAYDQPDKILNATDDDTGTMAPALRALLTEVHSEAIIISPYFIPGDTGVEDLAGWVNSGADITILTNSLSANDVPLVHAGYATYRRPLIEAGIKLWELRATTKRSKKEKDHSDLPGSSKASLHAKTMVFDRDTMFVGSMNLDPRSVNLNTEIGVVIYHEEMASLATDVILKELPRLAWRLEVETSERWWGQSKTLLWLDESTWPVTIVSEGSEPEVSTWSRFQAWLFRCLPVEALL